MSATSSSVNAFLHPRNPYKQRPNFKELVKIDARFRQKAKLDLTGKVTVDFNDRDAVSALSAALLRKDFNLDVNLPANHLVPTLPLR